MRNNTLQDVLPNTLLVLSFPDILTDLYPKALRLSNVQSKTVAGQLFALFFQNQLSTSLLIWLMPHADL